MVIHRRSFLVGLGASLFAAPAIVRAASLMPVRAVEDWRPVLYGDISGEVWGEIESPMVIQTSVPASTWRMINMGAPYRKTDA